RLGLKPADFWLIGLLHSYGSFADSTIRPTMQTLAQQAGSSQDTVSRAVARLEAMGLLSLQRGAGQRVVTYDLAPLWERLAALVRESKPDPRVIDGGTQTADLDLR